MKKYIITFCMALVAIAGSFTAAAQEALTVLQLHLTDGTTDKYLLAEKPVVTFSDGNLLITSSAVTSTYEFSAVESYDFGIDTTTGVDGIGAEDNTFSFQLAGDVLTVASPELSVVEVYALNGVKAAAATAADGVATVDLAALPAGVYVVATNCHAAVKIVKK